LAQLTGIPIEVDPTLHGAGIHVMGDGDHLDELLRTWMSGTALAAGLPEGRLAEAFHVVSTA